MKNLLPLFAFRRFGLEALSFLLLMFIIIEKDEAERSNGEA